MSNVLTSNARNGSDEFRIDTNYAITFFKDDQEMGTLDLNGDQMEFRGYAAASAKVFFDYVATQFSERLKAERIRGRIEAMQPPEPTTERHHCDVRGKEAAYGPAVNECHEDEDGTLWVGNGEYYTQVRFCPECGYAAKVDPVTEG